MTSPLAAFATAAGYQFLISIVSHRSWLEGILGFVGYFWDDDDWVENCLRYDYMLFLPRIWFHIGFAEKKDKKKGRFYFLSMYV